MNVKKLTLLLGSAALFAGAVAVCVPEAPAWARDGVRAERSKAAPKNQKRRNQRLEKRMEHAAEFCDQIPAAVLSEETDTDTQERTGRDKDGDGADSTPAAAAFERTLAQQREQETNRNTRAGRGTTAEMTGLPMDLSVAEIQEACRKKRAEMQE